MQMNEMRQDRENQQITEAVETVREEEREYIQAIPETGNRRESNNHSPFTKRIKRGAAILLTASIFTFLLFGLNGSSTSVNTSKDAADAIETHVSTTLGAGTRILKKDSNFVAQDHTITHKFKGDETSIWVWDYAAEDGDYVQVLVNGTPLGDSFMIKNEAVKLTVPAEGEVQVVGTRDGGGGITYGIYYEANQTTYFNGMNEGGNNTYTLIREIAE